MAKQEAEQQLRDQQIQIQNKREENKLLRRQEELRLQLQQQEDEVRLQQHERELENEREKAEAHEEQRLLKLIKGSSRASGSVADGIESVGSRGNRERTKGRAESVPQQSSTRRPLSPDLSTLPRTSHKP